MATTERRIRIMREGLNLKRAMFVGTTGAVYGLGCSLAFALIASAAYLIGGTALMVVALTLCTLFSVLLGWILLGLAWREKEDRVAYLLAGIVKVFFWGLFSTILFPVVSYLGIRKIRETGDLAVIMNRLLGREYAG